MDIRSVESRDKQAVRSLLTASLGAPADGRYGEHLAWKHDANPFGASPGWVAVREGVVVGFRAFLRWEFLRDGEVVRAVRAVDTATHPDFQRQGIFSKLTHHAVNELRREGVSFIFNTPNAHSLPGYLKLGWQSLGRFSVELSIRSLRSLPRVLSARVPAERWPVECLFGHAASDVLAGPVAESLAELGSPTRTGRELITNRSAEYLRWRYGFPAMGYRALPVHQAPEDGLIIFRVRRRGRILEVALCDILPRRPYPWRTVVRRLIRGCRGDAVTSLARPGFPPRHLLTVPRIGPALVWRGLDQLPVPDWKDWHLTLGDIELF